jgi:hypothetical protein
MVAAAVLKRLLWNYVFDRNETLCSVKGFIAVKTVLIGIRGFANRSASKGMHGFWWAGSLS